MHYVRGRMLEVAPAAYRAACTTATTTTADPSRTMYAVAPPSTPPVATVISSVSSAGGGTPPATLGGGEGAATAVGTVKHRGMNCYDECGEAEGLCPQHCGSAGACCKRGFVDADSDPACGGGQVGCDTGYCCVRALAVAH
jgi:hypothetical protein